MKAFILSLSLLVAAPVLADVWTINPTAGQVTKTNRQATRMNKVTCARFSLAPSCTQVQARTAFCSQLGSSGPPPCTVGNESSNDVKIFADGRDLVDRSGLAQLVAIWITEQRAEDVAAGCAVWNAMSQAQQDATCAAMSPSQPPGCVVCP